MSRTVRADRKPKQAAKPSARMSFVDDAQQWKPGWQQEVLARRIGRVTASPAGVGLPAVARERLERALCGVLERRHPGRRFAVKGEVDAGGQGAAPASDADGLKDGL